MFFGRRKHDKKVMQKMSLLQEYDQEGLYELVIDGLTDDETQLLSKEVNEKLLRRLIDEKFANELFAGVKASVIADGIKDNFVKNAVIGDTYNLIYVGSIDQFEKTQAVDRAQQALFYDVDQEQFTEYKVWGRYPGFRETDEFSPGNLYAIEIVPKTVEYNGEERTFYNPRSYKLIENRSDELRDLIYNYEGELGDIIDDATEGEFTESVVTLLGERLKYETVPFDFEVISVRPVATTERVENGVDDNETMTYKNKSIFKQDPDTGEDVIVPQPVVHVAETGISNLVFAITGKAQLEDDREITYFGTFYPSRMSQYLVDSETIQEAVSSEVFLSSTPEQQADYLNYLLSGKEFTGIGNIRRLESGNDTSSLLINVNMLAMVEL